MKNTIKIKIPDNLSEEQEAFAIGKKLAIKSRIGNGVNKDVKRIGDELNIKNLTTTIIIEREATEKPIIMLTCNVCNCDYQSDMAKYYYHNYGGKRQRRSVCSDKCVQFMIDNFGARVQKSASKLPNPINYFKR